MRLNFGTGIAVFYTIFAATMIFFVFKSTQYDHSLVREDYYKGDLEYQHHYDKLQNTKMLNSEVVIYHQAAQKQLVINFPTELKAINGEAILFRPSNSGQDVKVELDTDENLNQIISTENLQNGRWMIKLDWVSNGKPYYKEMNLVL